MGGRGSASAAGRSGTNSGGRDVLQNATQKQREIVERYKRNIYKLPNAVPESLEFTVGESGRINFSFIEKDLAVHSHVGKMVDPLKDKMFDRTTTKSGQIYPDGLVIRNKPIIQTEYIGTRKQLLKQGVKVWDGT